MDNITIYNIEQGSEAWHELRCGRITASKFSDIMQTKSTLGYNGLINTVVGEIISQTIEDSYSNADMERGIELEDDAALEYQLLNDIEVSKVGFVTNSLYHSEYVGVSPDRLVGNGLLEIKCPKMKTHIGYLRSKKLPNKYKWQVQGQLLITGADYCDFMSYYPNIKPFILRVEPDKEIQQELINRLSEAVSEIEEVLKSI